MDLREHWERVYSTKAAEQLSWFEPLPEVSLRLLAAAGMTTDSCVLDVGGGESRLVDYLLEHGLECLAVLDVSSAALDQARTRLGSAAAVPTWIAADVTSAWTLKPMDIWHDRAVFHFLVDVDGRARYREHLRAVVKPGGSAIIATFAADGPEKCSGLPVARYSPGTLAAEFAGILDLVESLHYAHTTPWGATQSFQYSRFVKH